jgi:hypothetical protein
LAQLTNKFGEGKCFSVNLIGALDRILMGRAKQISIRFSGKFSGKKVLKKKFKI